MFINGTIAATMDPKVVEYNAMNNPNCKIIFIGDSVGYDDMIKYYRILVASPFVPDYNVMEADIEGSIYEFRQKYAEFLSSQAARQYFATILAALHMGRFILLFFPPESNGLKYPIELLSYFAMMYGITVAYPELGVQYVYDTSFTERNASILYEYNLIPPEDYLQYVQPRNINYMKVIMDMRLQVKPNTSMDTVINWVSKYQDRILKANKPLIRPFNLEVRDSNANSA